MMEEETLVDVLVKDGYVIVLIANEEDDCQRVVVIRGHVLRDLDVKDTGFRDEHELVRYVNDLIEEDKAGQVEDEAT